MFNITDGENDISRGDKPVEHRAAILRSALREDTEDTGCFFVVVVV